MKPSHRYEFRAADLTRMLAWPFGMIGAFALAMHLAKGVAPAPFPLLDVDRTILLHQAEASRQANPAEIILIGDSSCLMSVSASQLQQALGKPVLNLATLSYVDMETHLRLIRNHCATNAGQPKTVVLLMHPESLRLARRNEYFSDVIRHYLAGEDFCTPNESESSCLAGVGIFKGRILARALPVPLPGVYGREYGFTRNLWDFMTEHRGSMIDPRNFTQGEGSAEYRLATQLKLPSERFRAELPSGIKLAVGITPAPASFVLPSHAEVCERMLKEWAEWLKADGILALPCSLPDDMFASTTHLNPEGTEALSALLAEALRQGGVNGR